MQDKARHQTNVHFGEDLELLNHPDMLPMRIDDQVATIKLAMYGDIGERLMQMDSGATYLFTSLRSYCSIETLAKYHFSSQQIFEEDRFF